MPILAPRETARRRDMLQLSQNYQLIDKIVPLFTKDIKTGKLIASQLRPTAMYVDWKPSNSTMIEISTSSQEA